MSNHPHSQDEDEGREFPFIYDDAPILPGHVAFQRGRKPLKANSTAVAPSPRRGRISLAPEAHSLTHSTPRALASRPSPVQIAKMELLTATYSPVPVARSYRSTMATASIEIARGLYMGVHYQ